MYGCVFGTYPGSYVRSIPDCALRGLLIVELPSSHLSRFLLKKNRPSVMTAARNMRAPITLPAIAAIDIPPPEFDEVAGLAPEEVVALEGELADEVGIPDVEEGERLLRHVLSSEAPTLMMSELPPLRPFASTIMNIIDVPCATFAFQSYDVDPDGRGRITEFPPGIMPCQSGEVRCSNNRGAHSSLL